jgi:hypothetical protein
MSKVFSRSLLTVLSTELLASRREQKNYSNDPKRQTTVTHASLYVNAAAQK